MHPNGAKRESLGDPPRQVERLLPSLNLPNFLLEVPGYESSTHSVPEVEDDVPKPLRPPIPDLFAFDVTQVCQETRMGMSLERGEAHQLAGHCVLDQGCEEQWPRRIGAEVFIRLPRRRSRGDGIPAGDQAPNGEKVGILDKFS